MTDYYSTRYTRDHGRPRWTKENEDQLQAALIDGVEKSLRKWKGRTYGVIA